MTAILNFLKGIATGVTTIIEFVISFFEDVAYIVSLLAEFVLQVPELLSFLPSPVLASVVSLFAIIVIYKILGREG